MATGAVKLEMAVGLATGAAAGVGVAAGHARWRHSAEVWGQRRCQRGGVMAIHAFDLAVVVPQHQVAQRGVD